MGIPDLDHLRPGHVQYYHLLQFGSPFNSRECAVCGAGACPSEQKEANQKLRAFLANRSEKKYKKKVLKQGAGRELNYNKSTTEVKTMLDETRRKEWDNWKKYSNMKKISRSDFEDMKKKDPSLRIIPTRWVDIDKAEKGNDPKLKSRFVVRGDLEDASRMRTDSPTASQVAMGLTLSYAASTGRTLKSGDISAAFLQGSQLDRKLVLGSPYDMEEDDLIVVSTTVYGTKDAPRGWFKNLDGTLVSHGLRRVPMEAGFYVLNGQRDDGATYIRGLLLIHVDDLLWSGDELLDKIMADVQQTYHFGSLEVQDFKYCGRRLQQTSQGISVTCPDLISRVRPIVLDQRRRGQRDQAATETEKNQLRSIIGSLNWLVRVCRPDIAYSVARLQSAMAKPSVQDLVDANGLVKYVARTKGEGLFYPKAALDFSDLMIVAIQDASYAADYDVSVTGDKLGHRSQSGRILCLAAREYGQCLDGVLYPVQWHSTIIRRVCRSTMQSETLSLQLGATEAEHLRGVVHGLYTDFGKLGTESWMVDAQDRTQVLWVTDCYSLLSHLLNPAAGSVADKRLAIDLCALRQELWRGHGQTVGDPLGSDRISENASTQVVCTTTNRMVADCLTKRIVAHSPIQRLMKGESICIVPILARKLLRV